MEISEKTKSYSSDELEMMSDLKARDIIRAQKEFKDIEDTPVASARPEISN